MRKPLSVYPVLAAALLVLAVAQAPTAWAQEQAKPARQATIGAQPAQTSQPASTASTRLTAPGSDPLKYICNSGNCACAGVQDCVDMKDICMPETLGCNQYGCTCKEGDSGGEGG